jgi:transcriptional regulator with XRE-family HTH domain
MLPSRAKEKRAAKAAKPTVIMVPVQSRMARAGLGLQVVEVAKLAKVAHTTILRFERGEELKPRTVEAIQRAYEAVGVEFLDGDAPGVRLPQHPNRV